MQRKTLITAAVAALLPLAGSALAADNDQNQSSSASQGTFSSMDTNQDGRISRTEASTDSELGKSFSQADKNGDGYLDNTEWSGRDMSSGSQSSSSSSSSSDSSTTQPSTTQPSTTQPSGSTPPQ
jgi:hypothetical protein